MEEQKHIVVRFPENMKSEDAEKVISFLKDANYNVLGLPNCEIDQVEFIKL